MLSVEAMRTAQGKFGKKPLTGEQVRWGLENLNLDASALKELGFGGMIAADEDHLRRPRGHGLGAHPAVGRQEVESRHPTG